MTLTQTIPACNAIWQTENGKVYKCPECLSPLHSSFEGDEQPDIICRGPVQPHTLTWEVREMLPVEWGPEVHTPAPESDTPPQRKRGGKPKDGGASNC